jgi:hypothetical protein
MNDERRCQESEAPLGGGIPQVHGSRMGLHWLAGDPAAVLGSPANYAQLGSWLVEVELGHVQSGISGIWGGFQLAAGLKYDMAMRVAAQGGTCTLKDATDASYYVS